MENKKKKLKNRVYKLKGQLRTVLKSDLISGVPLSASYGRKSVVGCSLYVETIFLPFFSFIGVWKELYVVYKKLVGLNQNEQ